MRELNWFTQIWRRLDPVDAKSVVRPGKPLARDETEYDALVPQRQRAEMSAGYRQEK